MFGRRNPKKQRPAPEWTRQKMLALVIGGAVAALVMVVGVVLTVVYAVSPSDRGGRTAGNDTAAGKAGGGAAESGGSRASTDPRDLLAAKAMTTVDEDASHPSAVSTRDPGVITVPRPTGTGPAQVYTGFPHTPAGAMAQLAAIDQAAMQSGSLTGARTVITKWAAAGGPTPSNWSVIEGLGTLFDQLAVSGGGSGQLAIVFTPLMGQLKGTVGADFVVPCIDFELDVTFNQTARGATADCQRMVWQPTAPASVGTTTTATAAPANDPIARAGGRWVIGPGDEPATPPSVWPDTDLAISVGYKDLRQEPQS